MQRRSARIAWWVAGAGWVATLALVGGLVSLLPLKRVEPFVIRVDNASGMVDVVPVYVGKRSDAGGGEPLFSYSLRDGV